MIREISISQFKCFEALSLRLGRLTLLTGVNASGKSTVVQALALLRQSAVAAEWSGALVLDGESVQLGSVADVVDKVYGRRSFELGVSGEAFSARWCFGDPEGQDREAVEAPIHALSWREGPEDVPAVDFGPAGSTGYQALLPVALQGQTAHDLRRHLARIDHIGAERLGPRETYRLGPESWHEVSGVNGERAPGALWWFGDDAVPRSLCLAGSPPTLRAQTQAWLDRFFPGVVWQVERIPNANAVTMGFRTNNKTGFHRPQHVGYGVTHVLPLLVSGLRAAAGRMLIVENPEVHLHPAGQAAIGYFLAEVAQNGATVLVETHSDHVLNGMRRAVRDAVLSPEDIAVHFFREREIAAASASAQVVSLQVDREGGIDHWPSGFFDQFDLDMNILAGLGG